MVFAAPMTVVIFVVVNKLYAQVDLREPAPILGRPKK